jgi:hypothetical protein
MNITSRPYLTAGVAALGAGALALSAVQPIPTDLAMAPQSVVSNLSVDLAAAIDPITPWVNAIKSAAENAFALQDAWNDNPFPIIRTFVENQFTYLSELPNIGLIFQQITGNIGNFLQAPFAADPLNVSGTPVPGASPAFVTQQLAYGLVSGLLPAALRPTLALTTTPISGFLLGFAGPGLSSMLQLQETVQNIFNPPPGAKPLLNAVNEIINLPANLFNAAFNGGKFLDLTALVQRLLPDVPPSFIPTVGIRTGGFLNGGGVAFDSVAATVGPVDLPFVGPVTVNDPGIPVGFIGATGSLASYVADAIKVVPPSATAGVAAAAATPAVQPADATEAPVAAEVPALAEDAAPATDEAPARNRKGRAATRTDNSGGSDRASRAGRAARATG